MDKLRKALALIFLLFVATSASASNDLFLKGKRLADKARYYDALDALADVDDDHLLYDYVLFEMAECHERLGNKKKAYKYYMRVAGDYKYSPLSKRAFIKVIEFERKDDAESALKLVNKFLKRFLKDEKGRYLKASILKDLGQLDESKAILKEQMIGGGYYAVQAFFDLREAKEPVDAEDMKKSAKALMNRGVHGDVVELLKYYEAKDSDLIWLMAKALYSQRKYSRTKELIQDSYERNARILMALTLLKLNDKPQFEKLFKEMAKEDESDLYNIYYILAEIKRREGDYQECRKILTGMLNMYENKKEEILWGLAWLDVRTQNYEDAELQFKELAALNTASKDKYLFWVAKMKEYQGQNGDEYYDRISDNEDSYYAVRIRDFSRRKKALKDWGKLKEYQPRELKGSLKRAYLRAKLLGRLGLHEEAAAEIKHIYPDIAVSDITSFAPLLIKIDDYTTLLKLADKNPRVTFLKYPLAYRNIVFKQAKEKELDPLLVLSIMREESNYNPAVVSVSGALGLMQIMPAITKNAAYIKESDDLIDIAKNIRFGCGHLSYLLGKYKKLAHVVAAYNAGGSAVDGWLKKGNYMDEDEFIEDIPYTETRYYVKKVLKSYETYKALYGDVIQ